MLILYLTRKFATMLRKHQRGFAASASATEKFIFLARRKQLSLSSPHLSLLSRNSLAKWNHQDASSNYVIKKIVEGPDRFPKMDYVQVPGSVLELLQCKISVNQVLQFLGVWTVRSQIICKQRWWTRLVSWHTFLGKIPTCNKINFAWHEHYRAQQKPALSSHYTVDYPSRD